MTGGSKVFLMVSIGSIISRTINSSGKEKNSANVVNLGRAYFLHVWMILCLNMMKMKFIMYLVIRQYLSDNQETYLLIKNHRNDSTKY